MSKSAIRILANDGMETSAVQKLRANGMEVITEKILHDSLPQHINEFDVLTVRSATRVRQPLIDVMNRIQLIVRGGVGLDNIDVSYAEKKGIAVRNTPRASSLSVAELVFAHLYGMVRFLPDSNRKMPVSGISEFNSLKKKYAEGSELRGKTLGIIGFGNIGQETAKLAIGAGMNVLAFDPFVKQANLVLNLMGKQVSIPVFTINKEEVLRQSDFISIHAAGQSEMISKAEFEIMKHGVGIINCARGGVIREETLLHFLHSGKVAFAGIDVYEEEPTKNAALLSHPHISLTPHIGASTKEAQQRIGAEVADIILNFAFQAKPKT
jgi:D-3-phosphoglycerate dehydrogenase